MSMGRAAELTVTVDDSDPTTLLILAGTMVFFSLISFGLARLARRLPRRIPAFPIVVACACAVPLIMTGLGFAAFEGDESFVEWITSRAPRAYRNIAVLLGTSLLAAAFGLGRRKPLLDISTFD